MSHRYENACYRIRRKPVQHALAWLAAIGIFVLMVVGAHYMPLPAQMQAPGGCPGYEAGQGCEGR